MVSTRIARQRALNMYPLAGAAWQRWLETGIYDGGASFIGERILSMTAEQEVRGELQPTIDRLTRERDEALAKLAAHERDIDADLRSVGVDSEHLEKFAVEYVAQVRRELAEKS